MLAMVGVMFGAVNGACTGSISNGVMVGNTWWAKDDMTSTCLKTQFTHGEAVAVCPTLGAGWSLPTISQANALLAQLGTTTATTWFPLVGNGNRGCVSMTQVGANGVWWLADGGSDGGAAIFTTAHRLYATGAGTMGSDYRYRAKCVHNGPQCFVHCYANDVLPSGANFTSSNLTLNLKNCTTLNLDSNNIGDIGARAIAEALKGNTALTRLSLNYNNIGDIGAAALAEMLKGNTALTVLFMNNNPVSCSNHGTMRVGPGRTLSLNFVTERICKCTGIWSGDLCETNVPATTALTVVFSMVALIALVYAAFVVNRKYIQPYRARRQAELVFGIAHPINVTTVGGDAYTLEDWGHCKDLKLALQKLAPPGELGDPSTFVLLDNDGWTAPPGGGGGADEIATEVDTKYGSAHRANMVQAAPDAARRGNGIIELTLVYKATGGGGVLPVGALREGASPAGGVTMKKVQQSDV